MTFKTFSSSLIAAFSISGVLSAQAAHMLKSPNGETIVTLNLVDGLPKWSASYAGNAFLKTSTLSLFSGKKTDKALTFENSSISTQTHDSTWTPTWGQQSKIRDHYTEASWKLDSKENTDVTVKVRAYNNAIAIRYIADSTDKRFSDQTGLDFTKDYTFWAANGERPNHGPLKLSAWDKKPIQAPMTIRVDKDLYCAVLEAGIYQQYPFNIRHTSGTHYYTHSKPTKFQNEAKTSWRVISLGKTAGELLTSPILYNLNPKCEVKDTSWIKPGFTLWDWRAWGATAPDGFTYDLDMKSWRRFIDFAARKENVRYLMLDANWYGPEFDPNMDPKKSRDHLLKQLADGEIVRSPAPDNWEEPIDVPGLIKYANNKGVGIILYINDKARKKFDFEETLATYQKWGAAGIKYGFMATSGDRKVRETRMIVELCAKYNLICDFHDGPIPGSGDARTYPNYLTREFCHAQADAKRAFSPDHFVTTMFINGLTGSLDMANGLYAIKGAEKVRPRIFEKINTTIVNETARTLINFAALQILPDIPEAYDAHPDLFEFIEKMPLNWDESHVISGEIGSHISMARRAGNRWWIGTSSNSRGGDFPLVLDFLEEGASYKAIIYSDAKGAHYKENPEAYEITKGTFKKGDLYTASLAPGGGHCILLEKQ